MKKHILVFLTVLFSNPLLLLSFNVEAATEEVVVNITSVFDADNQSSTTATGSFGDKLSVTPALQSGYEFVYWVVNGVVRPSLPLNHEFTIQSIMNLQAVFAKTGEKAVLFVDSNGALLKTEYLLEGQINVSDPYETFLVKPTKPGLIVKTVDRWLSHNGATLDNISNHTVFRLQYESDITKPLNLTVSGGFIKLNAEKLFNEVTIVEPVVPEGKVFSHWLKDGNLVSYEPVYAFTLIKDTALEAVFADGAPTKQPLLVMSDDMGIRGDMHTFISQFELPNEVEIVEMGYLLHKVDTQELTVDTVGVNRILINNYAISTNEFVLSFLKNEFHSLRSYLIYNDGTNLVTIYSNSLINKYEVTYYDEDGVTVLETLNVDYNETPVPTVTPTKAATLEYTYTFNEWVMLDSLNYKASYSATPVNYIITWIVDGVETVETLPYGSAIPEREDPSKTGYNFTGWEMTVPATMPAKDLVLTAQFTPIDYLITYHLDGGSNNGSNPVTYTIESETIRLESPTKTGYEFIGWYTDDTYAAKVTEIIQGSIENVEVFALFVQNIGLFTNNLGPDWINGSEGLVEDKFITAYKESSFTQSPTGKIQEINFTNYKRFALIQSFGTDGVIILNEKEGKPIVVTDPWAVTELQSLLAITDNNQNGILIDIIESNGSTYYVTDRRNSNGIFRIIDNAGVKSAEYLNYRVGIGTGTYGDIMWKEYTTAYKLAAQFMQPLGLPTGSVIRAEYTTKDLNEDGTYVTNNTTSLKIYTKQKFENGWIIQARMQKRNADGSLGGHEVVQHAAAPIMNDMYDLVTGLPNNTGLNETGAPVSLEFNVNGIRLQNFEYGYVKVEAGKATFIKDLVVDSQGIEMNRRVGMNRIWDRLRLDTGGINNTVNGIGWERLRVSQNFRDTVGQLIRDGVLTGTLTNPQVNHTGQTAPVTGIWFSFRDAKKPDGSAATYLGNANIFIYQTEWYREAYPLLTYLNTADFVDAENNLGRPIDYYQKVNNVYYQEFTGGLGYSVNGAAPVVVLDLQTWLGTYPSIEAALIGKGIA